MKEIIKSKKFKIASIIIGVVLCALIIFSLGVSVGLHKGKFSCRWGENYERNFVGSRENDSHKGFMPRPPEFMDRLEGREFRNAHGLAGEIISIAQDKIVVQDRDGKENTVIINDKTLIKSRRDNLKITDLQQNDEVVIMGKPGNDGMMQADLIRVFEKNLNSQITNSTNNGENQNNVPAENIPSESSITNQPINPSK